MAARLFFPLPRAFPFLFPAAPNTFCGPTVQALLKSVHCARSGPHFSPSFSSLPHPFSLQVQKRERLLAYLRCKVAELGTEGTAGGRILHANMHSANTQSANHHVGLAFWGTDPVKTETSIICLLLPIVYPAPHPHCQPHVHLQLWF